MNKPSQPAAAHSPAYCQAHYQTPQDHAAWDRLFDASGALLCTIARDRTLVQMSATATSLLGWPLDALLGQPYLDFVHPDDRPAAAAELDLAFQLPRNLGFEVRFRTRSGDYRWLSWVSEPVSGGERIHAIARDITERRHTDQRVQVAERDHARAIAILDATTDLVAMTDPAGHALYLNPAGRRLLGIAPTADVSQYSLLDWISPDYRDVVSSEMLPAVMTTGVWAGELELCGLHEGCIAVSQVAIAHRNADGQLEFVSTIARDISPQRQARETLKQSEERFRSLVANIPGAVYRCFHDEHWTMAYVSPAIEGITGYGASEFLHNRVRSFASVIHPEDRDRVATEVDAALQRHCSFSLEYRLQRADGPMRWIQECGRGVFDADGVLQWIDGVLFDVSDRKLAEIELQRFQQAVESSGEAISMADATGTPIYLNPAFLNLYGYASVAEFVAAGGMSAIAAAPADLDAVWATLRRGESWSGEVEHCTRAGQRFPVAARADCIRDPHGNMIGSFTVHRDISERRAAERAIADSQARLQESERLFRTLYKSNASAVLFLDETGIFDCNDRSLTLFGSSEVSALHGRHLWQLSPLVQPDGQDSETAATAYWTEAFQTQGCTYPWTFQRLNGSFFVADVSLSATELDGRTVVQAIVHDTSDRHAAEQALRASEARYRCLIEATAQIVWNTNPEGAFISEQPLWSTFTGQSFADYQGWGWLNAVHPDDRDAVATAWLRSLTQCVPYDFEHRLRRHDGECRIVHVRAVPILEADGTIREWVGVDTDITDQKQTQCAIEDQRRTLRALIDNAPMWIWTTSPSGQITLINRTFCEDLGVDEEAITAADHYWDLLGEEACATCRATDEDCWASPGPHFSTERFPFIDGQLHDLEVIKVRQEDATGQVVGLVGLAVDATERRAAEAALRESQQRLQAILDYAPSIIFIKDLDGRFLVINRPGEEMLGRSAADIVGLRDGDLFPAAIAAAHEQVDQTVIASGHPQQVETEVRYADGTPHTLLTLKFPLLDDAGAPFALCGIATDITDRKQAEKERQNLLSILEATTDFVGTSDAEGRMIYLNRAGRQMLGIGETEDLSTVMLWDFVAEGDRTEFQDQRLPRLIREGIWQGEGRFQHRDGTVVPVSQVAIAHKSSSGEVEFFSNVARDITHLKQTESALIESKSRLQRQFEREQLINYLSSHIRRSLDTPEEETIALALDEIRNLLQVDRVHFAWYITEVAAGEEPYWSVIAESCRANLPSLIGRYPVSSLGQAAQRLLNLEPLVFDNLEQMTDPDYRRVIAAAGYQAILVVPVAVRDGEIGILSCGHHQSDRPWDASEIELLQAVLTQIAIATNQANLFAQSQEAAELARAKAAELEVALNQLQRTQAQLVQTEKMSSLGQLVAGVAHEINNPVNFIYGNLAHANDYVQDLLGLLDLYREQYPEPAEAIVAEIEDIDLEFLLEDLPKILKSMQVGADRIKEIVASLRNFSRMDEAEVKAVNLHEGIDSTLMILHNRVKARGDRAGVEILKDYGELPRVECYAGQLNQVFMNILANAIDALEEAERASGEPRANQIRIETRSLENDQVRIAIADNGPGIPPHVQQRLFDPFFTTKPVGKGTGLGLSIAYQIVSDRHGGSLTCTSTPGTGTTFEITIPIHQPEATY
jgi:PAS domain S-box-containing protein